MLQPLMAGSPKCVKDYMVKMTEGETTVEVAPMKFLNKPIQVSANPTITPMVDQEKYP